MEMKKLEQLIKLVEQSSLTEFSYEDETMSIHMGKTVTVAAAPAAAPVLPAAAPAAAAPAEKKEEEPFFITSPIVGTFYSASAPDVPAYVRVGDHVRAGETVCIMEAMKLMNEIQAEFDCEIEAILVSNEQKIEYGQPLFRVKKL